MARDNQFNLQIRPEIDWRQVSKIAYELQRRLNSQRVRAGAGGRGGFGRRGDIIESMGLDSRRLLAHTGRINSFGEAIASAGERFAAWTIGARAIQSVTSAVRSLGKEMVTFEDQLVDVTKVMADVGREQAAALGDELISLAQKYSVAVKESTDAAKVFAQQGKNIVETAQLANYSLLLMRTSTLSGAESTELITGAMKQFRLEIEDLQPTLDGLNNVANKHAVLERDVAQAMQRSGTAARVAGMSFGEFTSIVTAMQAATRQGGQTIGTFLKTFLQRIRRPEALDLMEQMGIATKTSTGEFRNAFNVLADLSGRWDNLSDIQQRNLSMTVGGLRQYGRFVALIENFSEAVSANADFMAGAGSAQEELAKKTNTVDAAIKRLLASWTELGVTIGKAGVRDAMIGIIDTTAEAIRTISQLIDKFKLLAPAIVAVAGSLASPFLASAFGGFGGRLRERLTGLGGRGQAANLIGLTATQPRLPPTRTTTPPIQPRELTNIREALSRPTFAPAGAGTSFQFRQAEVATKMIELGKFEIPESEINRMKEGIAKSITTAQKPLVEQLSTMRQRQQTEVAAAKAIQTQQKVRIRELKQQPVPVDVPEAMQADMRATQQKTIASMEAMVSQRAKQIAELQTVNKQEQAGIKSQIASLNKLTGITDEFAGAIATGEGYISVEMKRAQAAFNNKAISADEYAKIMYKNMKRQIGSSNKEEQARHQLIAAMQAAAQEYRRRVEAGRRFEQQQQAAFISPAVGQTGLADLRREAKKIAEEGRDLRGRFVSKAERKAAQNALRNRERWAKYENNKMNQLLRRSTDSRLDAETKAIKGRDRLGRFISKTEQQRFKDMLNPLKRFELGLGSAQRNALTAGKVFQGLGEQVRKLNPIVQQWGFQIGGAVIGLGAGFDLLFGTMAQGAQQVKASERAWTDSLLIYTSSTLKSAQQFASVGFLFGPWGAAIGSLTGAIIGFVKAARESERKLREERRKAEEQEIEVGRIRGFQAIRDDIEKAYTQLAEGNAEAFEKSIVELSARLEKARQQIQFEEVFSQIFEDVDVVSETAQKDVNNAHKDFTIMSHRIDQISKSLAKSGVLLGIESISIDKVVRQYTHRLQQRIRDMQGLTTGPEFTFTEEQRQQIRGSIRDLVEKATSEPLRLGPRAKPLELIPQREVEVPTGTAREMGKFMREFWQITHRRGRIDRLDVRQRREILTDLRDFLARNIKQWKSLSAEYQQVFDRVIKLLVQDVHRYEDALRLFNEVINNSFEAVSSSINEQQRQMAQALKEFDLTRDFAKALGVKIPDALATAVERASLEDIDIVPLDIENVLGPLATQFPQKLREMLDLRARLPQITANEKALDAATDAFNATMSRSANLVTRLTLLFRDLENSNTSLADSARQSAVRVALAYKIFEEVAKQDIDLGRGSEQVRLVLQENLQAWVSEAFGPQYRALVNDTVGQILYDAQGKMREDDSVRRALTELLQRTENETQNIIKLGQKNQSIWHAYLQNVTKEAEIAFTNLGIQAKAAAVTGKELDFSALVASMSSLREHTQELIVAEAQNLKSLDKRKTVLADTAREELKAHDKRIEGMKRMVKAAESGLEQIDKSDSELVKQQTAAIEGAKASVKRLVDERKNLIRTQITEANLIDKQISNSKKQLENLEAGEKQLTLSNIQLSYMSSTLEGLTEVTKRYNLAANETKNALNETLQLGTADANQRITLINRVHDIQMGALNERLAAVRQLAAQGGISLDLGNIGRTINDLQDTIKTLEARQAQNVLTENERRRLELSRQNLKIAREYLDVHKDTYGELKDSYQKLLAAGRERANLIRTLVTGTPQQKTQAFFTYKFGTRLRKAFESGVLTFEQTLAKVQFAPPKLRAGIFQILEQSAKFREALAGPDAQDIGDRLRAMNEDFMRNGVNLVRLMSDRFNVFGSAVDKFDKVVTTRLGAINQFSDLAPVMAAVSNVTRDVLNEAIVGAQQAVQPEDTSTASAVRNFTQQAALLANSQDILKASMDEGTTKLSSSMSTLNSSIERLTEIEEEKQSERQAPNEGQRVDEEIQVTGEFTHQHRGLGTGLNEDDRTKLRTIEKLVKLLVETKIVKVKQSSGNPKVDAKASG